MFKKRIPGRIKRQLTTGTPPPPSYSTLLLRQGIDSVYPRPYVHKVGSVGRTPVPHPKGDFLKAVGLTTRGSSPRFPKKLPYRASVGLGRDITTSGEVVCIDPSCWTSEDNWLDYIGVARQYRPKGTMVSVTYTPYSLQQEVTREFPTTACCICSSPEDFIEWSNGMIEPQEAMMLWGEMVGPRGGIVGGQRPPFLR